MSGIHPDTIPRDLHAPEILTEIIRYLERPELACFIRVNKLFFECGVDELYKEIPRDRMCPATQAFRQGPRRARYTEAVQVLVTDESFEDLPFTLSTALLAFPNLQYVRSRCSSDVHGRWHSAHYPRTGWKIQCTSSKPCLVQLSKPVSYDVSAGGPPDQPRSVLRIGDELLTATVTLHVHLTSTTCLTFVPQSVVAAAADQSHLLPRSDWVLPYLTSTRNIESIEVGPTGPALRMCDLQQLCEERAERRLPPVRFIRSEAAWRYVPRELEAWLRSAEGLVELRMKFFTTPQQHAPAIFDFIRRHCPELQELHLAFHAPTKWPEGSKEARHRAGRPWPMIFRRLTPGQGVSQLSISFDASKPTPSREAIARMASHLPEQHHLQSRLPPPNDQNSDVLDDPHRLHQRIMGVIWHVATIVRFDCRTADLWVFGNHQKVMIELAVYACQTAMFDIGGMFADGGAKIDGLPLVDIPGHGNPSVQERKRREKAIWDHLQQIRYEIDKVIAAHPPVCF